MYMQAVCIYDIMDVITMVLLITVLRGSDVPSSACAIVPCRISGTLVLSLSMGAKIEKKKSH